MTTGRPALLLLAVLAACAEPPPDLVIVVQRDATPDAPAAIVAVDVRAGAIGDRDELFLASAGAQIVDAAISDDGGALAFATDDSSDPGVFIVDAHSRRRTKVSDETRVSRLFFAPRGEALVFDVGMLATEPEKTVRFVVPLVDGIGTPVQVQDEAAETMLPSFAADSDTMVFVDAREGGNALVVVDAFAHAPLATLAMQSVVEIDSSDIELTPDGRNVSLRVRTGPDGLGRLVTIDLEGALPSEGTPLVDVPGDDAVFGPVTAPDGRGVAATVIEYDGVEWGAGELVWTELVDGAPAASRTVAQLDSESSSADAWTPDGRFLIVPPTSGAALGIVLARREPQGDWPLFTLAFTADDATFPGSVQVSADSRWLVAGGGDGELYRVALDGDEPGDPERIDDGLGALRFLMTSDGTRVAFAGGDGADAGVYLFHDSSEVLRIDRNESPQLNFDFAIAPNDEALVFQSGSFLVPGVPTFVDIDGSPGRATTVLRDENRGRMVGFLVP